MVTSFCQGSLPGAGGYICYPQPAPNMFTVTAKSQVSPHAVLRAHWRDRTVNWHAHGLGQLFYELAEPDALVRASAS
jgi:hypothetical protein